MKHKPYNVVLLTLDRHAAGPAARIAPNLAASFPGLQLKIHAAVEWAKDETALQAAKDDIATAHLIVTSVIFLEEHIKAILSDLKARREKCDAFAGIIADQEIVQLTRMGDLDMMRPTTGAMALLKKLKPAKKSWKMLKRLQKLPSQKQWAKMILLRISVRLLVSGLALFCKTNHNSNLYTKER